MTYTFHIFTLICLIAFTGCATNPRTGDGTEAQVRKLLADVSVLRDAGARVRDVRFSRDREKILVLLDLPAGSQAPSPELFLHHDGFNRYRGDWFTADSQTARKKINIDLGNR